MPVRRLSIFFTIKAYTSIILFGGLFIWALVVTKGQGFLLTGSFDDSKVPLGSRSWAMVAGLNGVTGLYSTVEINIPGALAWLEMSWGTSHTECGRSPNDDPTPSDFSVSPLPRPCQSELESDPPLWLQRFAKNRRASWVQILAVP